MTADELARHFRMQPHPEGGFCVETYRSQRRIPTDALPAGWGVHSWSTGILFLLRQGECSHLHRIRQDEMWHFYLGGALRLAVIVPDVSASEPLLGQDVLAGHTVQCTVPAGSWFGASPGGNGLCPGRLHGGARLRIRRLRARHARRAPVPLPQHKALVEAFTTA